MTKNGRHRAAVLDALEGRERPLTAAYVSFVADLTYKQTIDTLQALHNANRVIRIGRKCRARWASLKLAPSTDAGARELEAAFRGFFNR